MDFNIYETEALGVHLFYMDTSLLDEFYDDEILSEYRKERLSKLKKETDKKLSLGVELLLIHAVKKYYPHISLPLEIKTDTHGKPRVTGVNFSLAHAGNIAVCAVSDTDVGVDIERTDRTNNGVAKKYFTKQEQELDFTHIWTRKEAVVKAHGGGIAIGLDTFEVITDTIVFMDKPYRLISIKPEITGYYISLCVQSGVAQNY